MADHFPVRITATALRSSRHAALLVAACLCGCAQPSLGRQNAGDQYYFGITHLVTPRTQGDLTAYKVQTLGAGIGDGATLGWESREQVIASPDKCQLVVIIRSDQAAQNARDILSQLGGKSPCIVDFSHS